MNRLLIILTVALQYASALQLTRRALPGAAAAATAIGTQNALAAAKPVLVLGANGGTGLECVKYLQKKGRPCVAATRTGEFVGEASKLVTVAKGTRGVENVPSRHRRGDGGAAYRPTPAQATSRASRASNPSSRSRPAPSSSRRARRARPTRRSRRTRRPSTTSDS